MNNSQRFVTKIPIKSLVFLVSFALPIAISELLSKRDNLSTQGYTPQSEIIVNQPADTNNLLDNSISTVSANGVLEIPAAVEAVGQPTALAYNVHSLPPLQHSESMQAIVERVKSTIANRGLLIDHLSISLIDLNAKTFCEYGAFQDRTPRFPASVSKLFWLVGYFSQLEQGLVSRGDLPADTLYKLAHKSDNESASRVLDLITNTQSGSNLKEEDLREWEDARQSINAFFEAAGYQLINVSQKNFPIPYLGLQGPEGRDLQMRGNSPTPLRNYLTTHDAARLMLEIATEQSVSSAASLEMQGLLTQDLDPDVWSQELYNSVEGFLGEGLPSDTQLVTKVGWTSSSRQEVAFVSSADGQTHYILSIIADHPAYADDWEIFPEISRLVFDEMSLR